MKKIMRALCIALCLVLLLQSVALADTGKIGQQYIVDGECSFTVNSAKEYDVFFNQESGSAKQWISVSFDLLNWRTDSFFVKTETEAKIVYDDDFEYEADHLFPDPVGSYRFNKDGISFLYVTAVDDNGKIAKNAIKGSGSSWFFDLYDDSSTYTDIYVSFGGSALYHYDPINDAFIWEDKVFESTDSSKTILDPLVQRTYHYVFLVPDIVAEEEGARELIFTVAGEEYAFRF